MKVFIYHAKCFDGLAAVSIAKKWAVDKKEEYRIVDGVYGEVVDMDIVKDNDVYFLDFSYKREDMLAVRESAKNVTVLDHHVSAEREIGDIWPIDQEHSGARLAWYHFYPYVVAPRFVILIEDRDLWKWEHEDTDAYNLFLSAFGRELKDFERAIEVPHKQAVDMGTAIKSYRDNLVESVAKNAVLIEFNGSKTASVNCPAALCSNVGNLLMNQHEEIDFAMCYFDAGHDRQFSLRSLDNKTDVSKVAEEFGGGGHHNAAGFRITQEELTSRLGM